MAEAGEGLTEFHYQEATTQAGAMKTNMHPGLYNSTCPEHTCVQELHLACVKGLCKCLMGYTPDSLGGCKSDAMSVVVMWISRAIITAFVLFICIIVLYLMFSRSSRRERRDSRESLLEGEGNDRACWYDAPPPYVEVVPPPPSYQDAIAHVEKACPVSDASAAPTTTSDAPGLTCRMDAPIRDFARTSCDFDCQLPFDTRSSQARVAPPERSACRPLASHHNDVAIHI
ncbi:uncharacterized protein LOC122258116 [Penaeus japonicus]|uniref:uncharacterized protein LOC122258116 n=1 Tax=Penaeus japonicus TaxID=27405 RepID=UPI001C711A85|nr:uncharacterized protein LOC122258116 [Penaeus japonicus]